jgi:hypothetical protein
MNRLSNAQRHRRAAGSDLPSARGHRRRHLDPGGHIVGGPTVLLSSALGLIVISRRREAVEAWLEQQADKR